MLFLKGRLIKIKTEDRILRTIDGIPASVLYCLPNNRERLLTDLISLSIKPIWICNNVYLENEDTVILFKLLNPIVAYQFLQKYKTLHLYKEAPSWWQPNFDECYTVNRTMPQLICIFNFLPIELNMMIFDELPISDLMKIATLSESMCDIIDNYFSCLYCQEWVRSFNLAKYIERYQLNRFTLNDVRWVLVKIGAGINHLTIIWDHSLSILNFAKEFCPNIQNVYTDSKINATLESSIRTIKNLNKTPSERSFSPPSELE